MDRWRELEPGVRWLAAAGGFGLWALVLAVVARLARPGRVTPDPTVVDPPGPEPVALAATLANRWSLDRDAVPATVLDLAARGHVSVRTWNDMVMVHVPDHRGRHPVTDDNGALTAYEEMVLDRLRLLARLSADGGVPAEALQHDSRTRAWRWWRGFRKAVYRDAAARGLARRRWPAWAILTAVVVSLAAGLLFGYAFAASVFADQPDTSNGDLLGAGTLYGSFAAIGLLFAAFRRPRLRDTDAGRAAATGWLGLRSTLATDPLVTNAGAADVSAVGRRLACAGAMGLAPQAIEPFTSLHRGNRREVWSPVAGYWRKVRVQYPRFGSGVYGMAPGGAIAVGLMFTLMTGLLLWFFVPMVLDLADGGIRRPLLAVPFMLLPLAPFLMVGLANLARGLSALLGPRQVVEGYVLRVERRSKTSGDSRTTFWYVVVDDGTSEALQPWKLNHEPQFGVNARVRAELAPALGHVRNVQVVEEGERPDHREKATETRTLAERLERRRSRTPTGEAAVKAMVAAAGLPDAETVSQLLGFTVTPDFEGTSPHPLTVVFRSGEHGHISVTRLDRHEFDQARPRWRRKRKLVRDLGDEAYRGWLGVMLIARRGDDAVNVSIGGVSGDTAGMQEAIARHVLGLPSRSDETRAEPQGYQFERYQP